MLNPIDAIAAPIDPIQYQQPKQLEDARIAEKTAGQSPI
jgi:hypothetical protein